MSNFLKTLAFALTLLTNNLHAQKINPDELLPGKMLNESIAAFQVADSKNPSGRFEGRNARSK